MKNQKPLTIELYVSQQKEANEERFGLDANQCICCGKLMKEGEKLYVHMNTIGQVVNPEIVTDENCEELTGFESQGCFPVGNSCAKKMKGFTFLLD